MDIVSSETRSRMMAGIGRKDTKPEMLVRKMIYHAGYRYRLHRKDLPGAPDLVMSGKRIGVFVHGCFWHQHAGCKYAKLPSTNAEFWGKKLMGNVSRDINTVSALLDSGWRVLIVWECATRNQELMTRMPEILVSWIEGADRFGEIPA